MAEKVEEKVEKEGVSEARAIARYVRIAPRKVRLVVDLIRGKHVAEALAILRHTPKAASPVVEKVLNSAVANAAHNYNMNPNNLYISKIYVDEGPTLKRYRPRAMGRASRINKRTSHITVVVSEKKEG
ncbi:MAG: 50S ribosomal protein L22 [Bacillus thermozeamaize]|jgi:large subunit ribosomal protein L22|uniref:Large ribosomal subunit protein uL22 n=1 Tax=Bacillus thermozeamaize TaxID=230954 RepID=A0A1Y3PKQ5_9BACI|nr:MAG: 50S ribosomal protein L22 [Bacillus thermozeamaize]